ncbi:hypothetical protein D021_4501B, partial [Vibrio parahaemolyticus 10296]
YQLASSVCSYPWYRRHNQPVWLAG